MTKLHFKSTDFGHNQVEVLAKNNYEVFNPLCLNSNPEVQLPESVRETICSSKSEVVYNFLVILEN